MNTEDASSFINGYGSDFRNRICFVWNGKHATDFRDENDLFRQEVIAAVLAEPDKSGLDIIADLFEAEARWSKESCCVRDEFSTLGSILLKRGGIAKLDHFLSWFAVSFDSYSECHAMSLDPVTLDLLISEINRRLADASDDCQKARLEMAKVLFAKHKSGNPLKGMFKVPLSELGKPKIVGRSEALLDRLKKVFKR